MMQKFHAKAPTRIDLAGGTVDIWPIYLFFSPSFTINLGIDLFAEAELTVHSGGSGQVTLSSADQGASLKLGIDAFLAAQEPQLPPQLVLHGKLLRHFVRKRAEKAQDTHSLDIEIQTRAKSPAGAGLGGSSTLSVALVAALARWAWGRELDPLQDGYALVELVRDIETTVIQVPAGVQDYFGAMLGELQRLEWRPGKHDRIAYGSDTRLEIEKRLLLFYSGQSRNSGINNWLLFKHFIDRAGPVRQQFEQISRATQDLDRSLHARDWKGVGAAIEAEWATRRELAPGISTPEIDRAFETAKRLSGGTSAGKICGAGGGGCFFVYLPSGDSTEKLTVRQAIEQNGVKCLEFHSVGRGVEVQVS